MGAIHIYHRYAQVKVSVVIGAVKRCPFPDHWTTRHGVPVKLSWEGCRSSPGQAVGGGPIAIERRAALLRVGAPLYVGLLRPHARTR